MNKVRTQLDTLLTLIEEKQITTRKTAELLDMHPSRWCDIKFKREVPTEAESEKMQKLTSELFEEMWNQIDDVLGD